MEQLKRVWSPSGIDLFVYLEIPRGIPEPPTCGKGQSHASVSTSSQEGPVDESPHPTQTLLHGRQEDCREVPGKESGMGPRAHGDPSGATVALAELDDECRRPTEEPSRSPAQNETDRPWDKGLDLEESRRLGQDGSEQVNEQSCRDDHEYRRGSEGLPKECVSGSFSPSHYTEGDHRRQRHLHFENGPIDSQVCSHFTRSEDLVDQCAALVKEDEEPFACNENRRWSPVLEDCSCNSAQMNVERDQDDQVTECRQEMAGFQVEREQGCDNLQLSSISCHDNIHEAADVTEVEHEANPNLQTPPRRNPGIDSFNVAEISAAWQLMKMTSDSWDCRETFNEEIKERTALKERDVYNLGLRGVSNLDRISRMVEKLQSSLPVSDTYNAAHAKGAKKVEESCWSGDDSDTPRIIRANNGFRRVKSNSNRAYFRNSEIDEDSDGEVLGRPNRKRQYKSIRELVRRN